MKITMRFASKGKMERSLLQLPEQQRKEEARELNKVLLEILRDSKRKPPRVPVDTGYLQSTGYVLPADITGPVVHAEIGYSARYAALVHDNLADRKFKRPGAGAKFLETHLTARKDEIRDRLKVTFGAAWKKVRPVS